MIRHDMPERDYHAHLALNASTLKAVHKYPLKKVRHDLDNRPPTTRHSPSGQRRTGSSSKAPGTGSC